MLPRFLAMSIFFLNHVAHAQAQSTIRRIGKGKTMKERVLDGHMSRRTFLGVGATGLAATALHGLLPSRGRADNTPRARTTAPDGRPCAVVRTAEFFGDEEMVLTFPHGWQVQTCYMDGHFAPPLTDDEIRTALRSTVQTGRIAELAQGKRSVVITFDDCARPTPTGRVVPFVIEELHAAGIGDDQIYFHGSFGTHAAMYQQDFTAKLGADIVAKYPVWNHDCFNGMTQVGTTSRGMPVKLSKRFVDADFKICISGVKPHGMAGYGGGAKAVVPGVASIETARYAHEELNSIERTAVAYVNNPVRLGMEEAARLANLDISVNIIMNGDRQVAGLFAGDVVGAHRAAVRVAHERYNTTLAQNADVVVSNAYPQSVEASKELKYCRMSLRDGGTAVLIQDTPAGQRKIHYLGWSGDLERRALRRRSRGLPVPQAAQVIIFNRWPCALDEMDYSPEVYHAKTWDEVVARLTRIHGEGTKVAVYPAAALAHEPMPLRM